MFINEDLHTNSERAKEFSLSPFPFPSPSQVLTIASPLESHPYICGILSNLGSWGSV